jgi:hypothetical protein
MTAGCGPLVGTGAAIGTLGAARLAGPSREVELRLERETSLGRSDS